MAIRKELEMAQVGTLDSSKQAILMGSAHGLPGVINLGQGGRFLIRFFTQLQSDGGPKVAGNAHPEII